jgi:glycosyltransferase involved in cell wall biosynthesis
LRFAPSSIAKADKVITISESSRREILKNYPEAKGKTEVILPAVDTKYFYRRGTYEIKKIKNKYNLPKNYILFTSTLEPRKNVHGLVEAYCLLPESIRKKFALVLVGGRGWQDEIIRKTIDKALSNGANIIQPGYVVDEDLPTVYSGADLFVFPSFYEGFGIPPLEAMACGVPVIASDNSSLPEVVGEAAIKIKAEDTAGITKAMIKVLSDPHLASSLRQRGLIQARKFTWEESADKLYKVFKGLVSD